MSAPTVSLLALLDSDPAAGILAVADLRERRAKAVAPAPWRPAPLFFAGKSSAYVDAGDDPTRPPVAHCAGENCRADAEHIAAEANPAHALAAVRRWRGVVERHRQRTGAYCATCYPVYWPCRDFRETADEARAYLGGAA